MTRIPNRVQMIQKSFQEKMKLKLRLKNESFGYEEREEQPRLIIFKMSMSKTLAQARQGER